MLLTILELLLDRTRCPEVVICPHSKLSGSGSIYILLIHRINISCSLSGLDIDEVHIRYLIPIDFPIMMRHVNAKRILIFVLPPKGANKVETTRNRKHFLITNSEFLLSIPCSLVDPGKHTVYLPSGLIYPSSSLLYALQSSYAILPDCNWLESSD